MAERRDVSKWDTIDGSDSGKDLEELCRCVPQLSAWAAVSIHTICSVPLCYLFLKFNRISQRRKVECSVVRVENRSLLRKVAIVWVIQRVLDEVTDEHLDTTRRSAVLLQIIGRDAWIAGVVSGRGVYERHLVVVPFVFRLWGRFGRPESSPSGQRCMVERVQGRFAASRDHDIKTRWQWRCSDSHHLCDARQDTVWRSSAPQWDGRQGVNQLVVRPPSSPMVACNKPVI